MTETLAAVIFPDDRAADAGAFRKWIISLGLREVSLSAARAACHLPGTGVCRRAQFL